MNIRGFSRTFASLSIYNYRLFWMGQVVSLTGTWMQTIAQAWLVLDLTNSPFALGVVSMLQFLPVTVFGLLGGVIADRLPKRKILLTTQTLSAFQALVLATLVLSDSVELWHVYLLALMLGTGSAVEFPTRHSFVIEMVGREQLTNAVALNSMVFNSARIVGPMVAGITISAVGVGGAFLLNAVSFLGTLSALALMRPSELHSAPRTEGGGHVLRHLGEGIHYALSRREIVVIIITLGTIGLFGYNFNAMLALIARFILDSDPVGFGSLTSAMGAGSLLGALSIAYARHASRKTLFAAAASFSVLLVAIGLSNWYMVTIALLVMWGVAAIMLTMSANTQLQLLVPDEMRGRVMSMYILLIAGSTPIGSLIIGAMASRIDVGVTIVIMGLLCLAGTTAGLLYSRRPQKDYEEQPLQTAAPSAP